MSRRYHTSITVDFNKSATKDFRRKTVVDIAKNTEATSSSESTDINDTSVVLNYDSAALAQRAYEYVYEYRKVNDMYLKIRYSGPEIDRTKCKIAYNLPRRDCSRNNCRYLHAEDTEDLPKLPVGRPKDNHSSGNLIIHSSSFENGTEIRTSTLEKPSMEHPFASPIMNFPAVQQPISTPQYFFVGNQLCVLQPVTSPTTTFPQLQSVIVDPRSASPSLSPHSSPPSAPLEDRYNRRSRPYDRPAADRGRRRSRSRSPPSPRRRRTSPVAAAAERRRRSRSPVPRYRRSSPPTIATTKVGSSEERPYNHR